MFAIIGSGFGLYGYLPAIAREGSQRVLLAERYRERFTAREELQTLANSIEWRMDETKVLAEAQVVVIAKRPGDQAYWVDDCLQRDNIQRLIIEKPIAETPEAAYTLIERLEASGRVFRIGYNFRYTNWGKQLLCWTKQQNESGSITFDWRFCAHHYSHKINSWKRFNSTGGGVLKFYGIHLVAMLAEMGYNRVISSQIAGEFADESEQWCSVFTGPELPICRIFIDSNAGVERFLVRATAESHRDDLLIDLQDPFTEEKSQSGDNSDRRIEVLSRLCRDLCHSNESYFIWYRKSIDLWSRIEECTQQVKLHLLTKSFDQS